MKRIYDEGFVSNGYDKDSIVAIRVSNGEFYLIGLMTDAVHYAVKRPMRPEKYVLDRCGILFDGDIMDVIKNHVEYNNMCLLYETNGDGKLICNEDAEYVNEYDEFLSLVNQYTRNGQSSSDDDHDIVMLSKDELSSFCDLLRDGDYVLIMTD